MDLENVKLIEAKPKQVLFAFFSMLADGRIDRDEFVEVTGSLINSGPLEPLEPVILGFLYDGLERVGEVASNKAFNPFPKRSVAELLADADEAEAAGRPNKARRLRVRAENRKNGVQ